MIYITGDTHIPVDIQKLSTKRFPEQKEMTQNDYVIICGDFGGVWDGSNEEKYWIKWLKSKNFTTLFIDGNHENFPRIYKYPELSWHSGRVHRIRDNIFHLMRGYVFTIDRKTIFTMGGAYSIDKYIRKEGYSWWKEELPTSTEYREAIKNLEERNKQVDYIITHTAPREIIRRMCKHPDKHDMELTGFLEWVMYEVEFKKWFFGHWHLDREVGENFRAVYFDVIPIK